jgi:hypothetical protein
MILIEGAKCVETGISEANSYSSIQLFGVPNASKHRIKQMQRRSYEALYSL